MPRQRRNQRPWNPGTCAFCGRSPTTSEHILPVWLREMFAPDDQDDFVYLLLNNGSRVKQGKPTVKARVLCEHCNNVWLGRVENRVKSLLTPFIEGRGPQSLLVEDQELIGFWAAKTALLFERRMGRRPSPYLFHEMYLKKTPPDGTLVLATHLANQALAFGPQGLEAPPDHSIMRRQGVCTMFVFGSLYLFIVIAPPDNNGLALPSMFPKVFPAEPGPIAWPPELKFHDLEAAVAVTNEMRKNIRSQGWRVV